MLIVVLVIGCGDLFAKCGRAFGNQHCLELTFIETLAPITPSKVREKGWSANFCEGVMISGTNIYKVIFTDREKCPDVGESLVGNLFKLCQDTGRWTAADFVFYPKPNEYCVKSHEVRIGEVNISAQKVKIGMLRSEVEQIFNEVDFDGWEKKTITYYEHPSVLIEVPYDEDFKTVVGEAKVSTGNSHGGTFATWNPWKKQQ